MQLGFRYLWINRYCIDQQNPQDVLASRWDGTRLWPTWSRNKIKVLECGGVYEESRITARDQGALGADLGVCLDYERMDISGGTVV